MHTHSHPDTNAKPSVQDVTDSSNALDNAATHMPMLKPAILLFILLSITNDRRRASDYAQSGKW